MSSHFVSDKPARILVVDSDPESRSALRTRLSTERYFLREEATAAGTMEQVKAWPPDAILMDPDLPDRDGVDVIRQLRSRKYASPIIVLSGRADEQDKVMCLDAGADDFVGKPLAIAELLARLRAALRRVAPISNDNGAVFRAGNIEVDFDKRQVRVNSRTVHLSPIEFDLFRIFAQHPDRVITYRQLIQEIWGSNHDKHLRSLRVYIAQLRRKLETGSHLQTESTIGYRFQTE